LGLNEKRRMVAGRRAWMPGDRGLGRRHSGVCLLRGIRRAAGCAGREWARGNGIWLL
jgi:hypothetical protein